MSVVRTITIQFVKWGLPEANGIRCQLLWAAILCLLLDACSPGSQKANEASSDSSDVTVIEQLKSEEIAENETSQEFANTSDADNDALPSLMDYAKAEEAMTVGRKC